MSTNLTIGTVLITREHLLACHVQTDGERLLDILDNSTTGFLRIRDVKVSRINCQTPSATLNNGVIRKSNILLAMLTADYHEAPERRKNKYSLKNRFDSFVVVEGFEVRGKLHAKGEPDAVSFLTSHASDFVPLTDASVSFPGRSENLQSVFVIINKTSIDFLHIADNRSDPDDVLNSLRELINA